MIFKNEHETSYKPVVVDVDGVRSSRQSEEGRFGAPVVPAAVGVGARPGDRARGGDRGVGRWAAGGRRGRRRNGLWEMRLQAFLLTSLQAGYSRGHHQPGDAGAAAGRQRRAALAHGCAHVGRGGFN